MKLPCESTCPQQNQAAAISRYLREPIHRVETKVQRNSLLLKQLEFRRTSSANPIQIRQYCQSFEIEQEKEYLDLLAQDKRSRILASYHFGDYVYGTNTLASLEQVKREKYVLSQSPGGDVYFDNLRKALGELGASRSSELIYSATSASRLSALLRKGNCTLVLFCDLPQGFGGISNATTNVKFLNRVARFPMGPALLALSNRVPLMPVINFRDCKRNKIRFSRQIEPVLKLDESLQIGVNRITQQLVSFFELFFKRYPEQWRYLQLLPNYFEQKPG